MDKKYILLITVVLLFIMWSVFFVFLFRHAKNVERDPCSICATKVGMNVVCRIEGVTRVYDPNGTVTDNVQFTTRDLVDVNYTEFIENWDRINRDGATGSV